MNQWLHRGVLAIFLALPEVSAGQTAWEKAESLATEGKHAAALERIAEARNSLDPAKKSDAWRFTYPYPDSLRSALVGTKRHYLIFHESNEKVAALGKGIRRPILNDTDERYDFQERVVCIDTTSGNLLWSRVTMGRMGMGVEPGSDHLVVWRNKRVFKLNRDNGGVVFDKEVTLEKFGRLDGVMAAGTPLIRQPRGFNDEDCEFRKALMYNFATGEAVRTDVIHPQRLAPNEKSSLRLSTTWVGPRYGRRIELVGPDRSKQVWEYFHGGYSYNDLFWFNGDVIALNGDHDAKSEIVRLRGDSGKVVWRTPLPRGAWRSTHWENLRGAYPHGFQDSIAPTAEKLLAMGGEGALYFLDPATGRIERRVKLGGEPYQLPNIVGDNLIVCTSDELRAVPLKVILGPAAKDERDLAVLSAQCLAETGKTPQALKELEGILNDFPEFQPALAAKAEVCRGDDRRRDEAEARCRLLELSGKDADPVLKKKYGLIRRIATGQNLSTVLTEFKDSLYFGTEAGFVHELDTRTLEIVQSQEQPAAVLSLTPTGTLHAHFGDRSSDDVAGFPGTSVLKEIGQKHNGAPIPDPAVRWGRNHYVTLPGGHLRVNSAKGTEERKTKLKGITQWRLHFGPSGPLGYGGGGVFALDENLCPVRFLVRLEPRPGDTEPRTAVWLASDRTSFAYAVTDSHAQGGEIHVRSLDGRTERKPVPYRAPLRHHRGEGQRLISCGQGYLYAGHDLVWAPVSPDVPPWRFAIAPAEIEYRRADEAFRFLSIAVVRDHVFASATDGAVYVFDMAKFAK